MGRTRRHRPPGIHFEDLPRIDVELISHNHYDHVDAPTLRRLIDHDHPRVIARFGNATYLMKRGVSTAEDLDWWQSRELAAGVRITGVPARHWSPHSLFDRRRTRWLGYVIEAPAGVVYYAGDTVDEQFFSTTRERFASIPACHTAYRAAAATKGHGAASPVGGRGDARGQHARCIDGPRGPLRHLAARRRR